MVNNLTFNNFTDKNNEQSDTKDAIDFKALTYKERDYGESKLDFHYLTSPSLIESKVKILDNEEYIPMKYSNIFFSLKDFIKLNNQIAIQNDLNEKKIKKK